MRDGKIYADTSKRDMSPEESQQLVYLVEEVAALVALADCNIPVDIQELLVHGDPMRDIPPRALQKAIAAATRCRS